MQNWCLVLSQFYFIGSTIRMEGHLQGISKNIRCPLLLSAYCFMPSNSTNWDGQQAALAMISPAWAAAFASPPAAMALAMAAAGVGGGESFHRRNNYKSSDWRSSGLLSLSTFQKAPDTPVNTVSPTVKDKAAMKASALAAAREQERAARVGLARGLGAAAMASSVQWRALTDKERERRWNISNIMDTAWLQHDPEGENTGKDSSGLTHWTLGILPIMMETARKMRIREVIFLPL